MIKNNLLLISKSYGEKIKLSKKLRFCQSEFISDSKKIK